MSWNYRIVKEYKPGTKIAEYSIHEVYFTGDKPDSMAADEISPAGSNLWEFRKSVENYKRAFDKPVLIWNVDTNSFEGEEQSPTPANDTQQAPE